eukprot:14197612-Ditylum_brightwellii.AAC.1
MEGEVTDGVKILGMPLGLTEFVRGKLRKSTKNCTWTPKCFLVESRVRRQHSNCTVSMAVRGDQTGKCNNKINPPHPLKITMPSPPLIRPSHTAQKPQGTKAIRSALECSGIYGGTISTMHPPNMPGY